MTPKLKIDLVHLESWPRSKKIRSKNVRSKNGPQAGPGGELDHGPIKFFVIKDPGEPGLKFERASWTKKFSLRNTRVK